MVAVDVFNVPIHSIPPGRVNGIVFHDVRGVSHMRAQAAIMIHSRALKKRFMICAVQDGPRKINRSDFFRIHSLSKQFN